MPDEYKKFVCVCLYKMRKQNIAEKHGICEIPGFRVPIPCGIIHVCDVRITRGTALAPILIFSEQG